MAGVPSVTGGDFGKYVEKLIKVGQEKAKRIVNERKVKLQKSLGSLSDIADIGRKAEADILRAKAEIEPLGEPIETDICGHLIKFDSFEKQTQQGALGKPIETDIWGHPIKFDSFEKQMEQGSLGKPIETDIWGHKIKFDFLDN